MLWKAESFLFAFNVDSVWLLPGSTQNKLRHKHYKKKHVMNLLNDPSIRTPSNNYVKYKKKVFNLLVPDSVRMCRSGLELHLSVQLNYNLVYLSSLASSPTRIFQWLHWDGAGWTSRLEISGSVNFLAAFFGKTIFKWILKLSTVLRPRVPTTTDDERKMTVCEQAYF